MVRVLAVQSKAGCSAVCEVACMIMLLAVSIVPAFSIA